MRACVIGCGWAGKIHAAAYARDDRTQLIAVCDKDIDKAKFLANQYGCHFYQNHVDLLKSENIEIASLASPTSTHADIGAALLEDGVAVFCEKPLTRDSVSARNLKKLTEKARVPFSVNFNRRFASGYHYAHKRLGNNQQICFASSILAQNVPLAQTAKLRSSLPQDFLVFDALSHQIDLMRFLVGEIDQIQAICRNDTISHIWCDISVSLVFKSGAIGNIICSLTGPDFGQLPIEVSEIATDKERIIINNITESVEWFNYSGSTINKYTPPIFEPNNYIESIHDSVKAWINAVETGSEPPISINDGVRAVELCEQVRDSIIRSK
jgi:predicted dehydrogenase